MGSRFLAALLGALTGLVLGVACHTAPAPVPPSPDADSGLAPLPPGLTPCEAACAHLSSDGGLGCPEGDHPRCAQVCRAALETLTDLRPECVLRATSMASARACSPGLYCGLPPLVAVLPCIPYDPEECRDAPDHMLCVIEAARVRGAARDGGRPWCNPAPAPSGPVRHR